MEVLSLYEEMQNYGITPEASTYPTAAALELADAEVLNPRLGTPKAHKQKHFIGISLPYWASL